MGQINAKQAFEFCIKFQKLSDTDENYRTAKMNCMQNRSENWFFIEHTTNQHLVQEFTLFAKHFAINVTSEVSLDSYDMSSTKSMFGEWSREFTVVNVTEAYIGYYTAKDFSDEDINKWLTEQYINNL